MRRRRWFRFRLLAVGLAAAACAAPAAQAIPEDLDGADLRALRSGDREVVVSPDDRRDHGTSPQVGSSRDPRSVNLPAPQRAMASDDSGFELSGGTLAGIGLALLAVVAAGYAALQAFKADKATGI